LGEILMEIYRLGLGKKTLVVVVSDHGEAFGEHGAEGHARDLFAEVTRTPFILSFPFRLSPGGVVDGATENIDVWPTLLDMLGLPGLEDPDGESLAPLLLGLPAKPRSDMGFAQLDRNWGQIESEESPLVAVRKGSLRLIHSLEYPDRDLLFDVDLDPAERREIADGQDEQKKELLEDALSYLKREPLWLGGSDDVEIDEMQLRQLRALGYSIE
jgi:arylsulfatase A-like enzyme